MVQFKGTIFFHAADKGWSETYWLMGPDIGTASAKLVGILDARVAMSPSAVKTDYLRVVDAGNPRISTAPNIPAGDVQGTFVSAGGHAFTPDAAVLARAFSADNLRRSRWFIRGFPVEMVNLTGAGEDNELTFPAAWTTAFGAWAAAVGAGAVMVHKTAPHTFVTTPIDHIVSSTTYHIRRAGRPFGLPRGRRMIA